MTIRLPVWAGICLLILRLSSELSAATTDFPFIEWPLTARSGPAGYTGSGLHRSEDSTRSHGLGTAGNLEPIQELQPSKSLASRGLFSLEAPPIIRPVAFRVNNGALLPADMPDSKQSTRIVESIPTPSPGNWSRAHDEHKNTGFIDFNTYWDTREFAVTTINLLANLPGGFQFFQFANYDSQLGRGSHDWSEFFSETNIRHTLWKSNRWLSHLDWALQYADGSIAKGVLRGGVRWRIQDTPGKLGDWMSERLKLRYFVTLYFFETDSSGWQFEHVYRRDFFDGRMYVGGFCDHNINNGSQNSTWIHEHQIGFKLADSLYAVAEYRYKNFFPSNRRSGLGIGMEYVIRFK
ncbi:MAG: hypothetical protein AAGG48_15030 [Planctomycetota bacterium]